MKTEDISSVQEAPIHLTEEIIVMNNGKIRKKPKKVNLRFNSFKEMGDHKREILDLLNEKDDGYEYTEKNIDFRFTESPKKAKK